MNLHFAWSNNCRGVVCDQLYVIHAWIDGHGTKTLCGVKIQEIGDATSDPSLIGCKRCLRSKHLKAITAQP
jgi:hypothetical protein